VQGGDAGHGGMGGNLTMASGSSPMGSSGSISLTSFGGSQESNASGSVAISTGPADSLDSETKPFLNESGSILVETG